MKQGLPKQHSPARESSSINDCDHNDKQKPVEHEVNTSLWIRPLWMIEVKLNARTRKKPKIFWTERISNRLDANDQK